VDGLKARLASRNLNKARELEQLLPNWRIEPLEADDYPVEDGKTYYDNARGKALFGRTRAQPDEWALGEDSGIEVEALAGGPGVRSARSGGTLEGRISFEPRGTEGFGFDPIFIPAGEERTVAELGNSWKRENSHRANAARALLQALGKAG
jgi:XTP/dITP diphosphohydrolase